MCIRSTGFFGETASSCCSCGEFLVGPQRVIPPGAGDPLAFFVRGDGGGDALLHFFDGGDAVEADGEQVCAGAAQVNVGVVEAGHDEMVVELDRLGVFVAAAAFEHDLLDAADADDFSFADGHGGGPGMLRDRWCRCGRGGSRWCGAAEVLGLRGAMEQGERADKRAKTRETRG